MSDAIIWLTAAFFSQKAFKASDKDCAIRITWVASASDVTSKKSYKSLKSYECSTSFCTIRADKN